MVSNAGPAMAVWSAARRWASFRSAPGTASWLGVIAATTAVQLLTSPDVADRILLHVSSNLGNLLGHRLGVLLVSGFWLEGPLLVGHLAAWLALFAVVMAPAERWLGTRRWLAAVVLAHVGATLLTAGRLWLAIRLGHQPGSLVDAVDVGVSYGFVGIVGLSVYRLPPRWRWPYALALAAFLLAALRLQRDFTSAGHLNALLFGFALYPLIPRARPRPAA